MNNSHYELSYDFIKYDLYIDGYLVYLNNQLIATYRNLGVNELECIKNMVNEFMTNQFSNPTTDYYLLDSLRKTEKYISSFISSFRRFATEMESQKAILKKR